MEKTPFRMAMLGLGSDNVISEAVGPWRDIAGMAPSDIKGKKFQEVFRLEDGRLRGVASDSPLKGHVLAVDLPREDGGRVVLVGTLGGDDPIWRELVRTSQSASAGNLAGYVAHEFNNLFGAIIGFVDLANSTGKPETIEKALTVADKNLERATRLSRALLLYGRRAGEGLEVYSLGRAVEDVLLLTRKKFEKSKVQIVANIQTVPEGYFDVGACQLALMKVLENAACYAGANGEVTVTLLFDKETDTGQLTVADTGPGVQEEKMDRIFEPFSTGADDSSAGMGLGLAVARSTLEEAGCEISVGRDQDGRNAFTIVVPLRTDYARKHIL